jgi:hypothetical protein
MKKFIKKISVYLLLILLLLVVLDVVYTVVYFNSPVRNKVNFILNAPPKHYDAIILGSSRAENHIIPELFKRQGLDIYNFGMSGGSLCEDSLMLKLFFEKGNTVDTILLQVDIQFLYEVPAEGIQAWFLPYLPFKRTIYNHYEDNTKNVFALAYFPFYRYCKLDSKIGFRELVTALMNIKGKFYDTKGFAPLKETLSNNKKYDLPLEVCEKNKYYDEIVSASRQNGAQLISFMAPFCSYTNNTDFFSKLKAKVPQLYDYSHIITADSLFSTCGHLNENGAAVFSNMILDKHFGINKLKK